MMVPGPQPFLPSLLLLSCLPQRPNLLPSRYGFATQNFLTPMLP